MGRIHSIETFGTVDGPGIRFVVFFAGCPMRCLYCHNPDTWEMAAGEEMTTDVILDRMVRNACFYESGGITATGGEPTMQISFLTELFEKAKKKGISTCLDTCGILFDGGAAYDRLMAVTDLVMLDIKLANEEGHRALTGHANRSVLAFLEYLDKLNKDVWIRHVLVPGMTDGEEQLLALKEIIDAHPCVKRTEILPYHTMGEVKYEKLGLAYPLAGVRQANAEDVARAQKILGV